MTLSNLFRTLLLTLGLGVFACPSIAVAQPGWNQEFVNRPYWSGYYDGAMTNYDRDVNGSDASTPGHH
jgi:hypothetical protein